MALGWDTAVAEACAMLNVPFIAAVPFKGQERLWPQESQDRYRRLLSAASEVYFMSSSDYGYEPRLMHVRNRWMVDNCDRLVALWDGSAGGTGSCVQYAISQGRPWTNLWDRWIVSA